MWSFARCVVSVVECTLLTTLLFGSCLNIAVMLFSRVWLIAEVFLTPAVPPEVPPVARPVLACDNGPLTDIYSCSCCSTMSSETHSRVVASISPVIHRLLGERCPRMSLTLPCRPRASLRSPPQLSKTVLTLTWRIYVEEHGPASASAVRAQFRKLSVTLLYI